MSPAAPAPTAGSARLDACGETDDDADEGDSSKRACPGADAANRRRLAWCLVSDKLTKRNECSRRASRTLPEPGRITAATAAYDATAGPARLDACGETDDDADEEDSSKRACAGADEPFLAS